MTAGVEGPVEGAAGLGVGDHRTRRNGKHALQCPVTQSADAGGDAASGHADNGCVDGVGGVDIGDAEAARSAQGRVGFAQGRCR